MSRFPFLVIACSLAFTVPAARAGSVEEVIAEVESMQEASGLRTASIGFCLVPVDGEPDEAAGYRPDTGLVPASSLKAITTATAVEVLGPDFRFETELQTAGVLEEGTLAGNVVVRGGGDPTLGASDIDSVFAEWRAALAEAGVQKVEGSVVGDASLFGTRRLSESWQWNDIGNYYATGASGLTFYQNQFYCSFRTDDVGGEAALIGTDPDLPGVEFVNEMRVGAAGSGDQGYIYGAPYGRVYYLRGSVPANGRSFTIKGALPDPALFCARAFTEHLEENGVSVSGEPTTVRLMTIAGESLAARKVISTRRSDSLASLLVRTNHRSDNLRAECIHRRIGLAVEEEATIAAASDAVQEHWAGKGIDMTGFHMADGCGLSRANTVTPRQASLILRAAAKGEEFDAFYDSLPVAGRSGTLRSIGGGSAAEGRVRAKSGTLDRVRNYAGYLEARSGRRYAFALFVNGYDGSLGTVKARIVRVWSEMVGLPGEASD